MEKTSTNGSNGKCSLDQVLLALKHARGKATDAAKLLGVSVSAVTYWIHKYKLHGHVSDLKEQGLQQAQKEFEKATQTKKGMTI